MRPTFELEIDGEAPSDELARRLIRLKVSGEAGESAGSLEIKLANQPALEPPPTGVEALVRIGYAETALHDVGVFVVEGVDQNGPPNTMAIHGSATNFSTSDTSGGIKKAMRSQKTRSWDQITLGDIVRTIAGEQGLDPVVGKDLEGVAIKHLDQMDQSDMALLTQIGRRYDAVAKTMAGRLVFLPKGKATKADGTPLPDISLDAADLTSWKVRKTGKTQYGAVVAHWHDTDNAKREEIKVGEGEPVKTLRHDFPTQEEALDAANAELEKQRRQAQELSLKLPGRPDIFVEQPITIADGPPGTGGEWVVSRIEHTLSSQGLQTSITAGPKTE